jgi:hypothetical protein
MHPTVSASSPSLRHRVAPVACCLALGLAAASAAAAPPHQGNPRTYDRRIDLLRGAAEAPAAAQLERAAELKRQMPDLLVTYDPVTAAVRSLSNAGGPLSGPHPGAEPLAVAQEFLAEHLDLLGLSAADLAELEVTDIVPSEASGVTHLYLRQMHRGLPVYNAQLQVHLDAEGRVLSVNSDLLPDLALGVGSLEPRLAAAAAVAAAASASMSATITAAPSAASRCTVAAPMPCAPPVTTATFPSKRTWNSSVQRPGCVTVTSLRATGAREACGAARRERMTQSRSRFVTEERYNARGEKWLP